MTLGNLFDKWGLKVSLKIGIIDIDFKPNSSDRDAAWDLYVELITRIATQPLDNDDGTEETALESVYHLFNLTREIIKRHGRLCINFTKIAVVVLNQIVRPFTSKWHKLSLEKAFQNSKQCIEFRSDLMVLQSELQKYTKLLADLAEVEDLTNANT